MLKKRERCTRELSEYAVDALVNVELGFIVRSVPVLELVISKRVGMHCQVQAVHLVDELRTIIGDRVAVTLLIRLGVVHDVFRIGTDTVGVRCDVREVVCRRMACQLDQWQVRQSSKLRQSVLLERLDYDWNG